MRELHLLTLQFNQLWASQVHESWLCAEWQAALNQRKPTSVLGQRLLTQALTAKWVVPCQTVHTLTTSECKVLLLPQDDLMKCALATGLLRCRAGLRRLVLGQHLRNLREGVGPVVWRMYKAVEAAPEAAPAEAAIDLTNSNVIDQLGSLGTAVLLAPVRKNKPMYSRASFKLPRAWVESTHNKERGVLPLQAATYQRMFETGMPQWSWLI